MSETEEIIDAAKAGNRPRGAPVQNQLEESPSGGRHRKHRLPHHNEHCGTVPYRRYCGLTWQSHSQTQKSGRKAAQVTRRMIIGDDDTDEDMFRTFDGKGLTIAVGRFKSAAGWRIPRQSDVPRLLETICRARERE